MRRLHDWEGGSFHSRCHSPSPDVPIELVPYSGRERRANPKLQSKAAQNYCPSRCTGHFFWYRLLAYSTLLRRLDRTVASRCCFLPSEPVSGKPYKFSRFASRLSPLTRRCFRELNSMGIADR